MARIFLSLRNDVSDETVDEKKNEFSSRHIKVNVEQCERVVKSFEKFEQWQPRQMGRLTTWLGSSSTAFSMAPAERNTCRLAAKTRKSIIVDQPGFLFRLQVVLEFLVAQNNATNTSRTCPQTLESHGVSLKVTGYFH